MPQYQPECVLNAKAELGECPIWCPGEQRLYWIDIQQKHFNRFDPASGTNERWTLPQIPGSYVLNEGGGVTIAMQDGFYRFDPGGGLGSLKKTVDAPYDTSRLRFNDGRTDRAGRYWLGSMQIDMMAHGHEGAYYCFDGKSIIQKISPVEHANGTAFAPDGKTLYRAETTQRKIFAYDLDTASGTLSNERTFAIVPAELGMPDGATIDSDGGYWSALPAGPKGGSVARFTPDGKLDLVIEMPVAIVTMPAFGGPDLSTLYVTTARLERLVGLESKEESGGLFAVELPYKGVPETRFRGA